MLYSVLLYTFYIHQKGAYLWIGFEINAVNVESKIKVTLKMYQKLLFFSQRGGPGMISELFQMSIQKSWKKWVKTVGFE